MKLIELQTDREQLKQKAIDVLGRWLERAHAGEVVSVVVIGELADGECESERSANGDGYRLVGMLEAIKADVLSEGD